MAFGSREAMLHFPCGGSNRALLSHLEVTQDFSLGLDPLKDGFWREGVLGGNIEMTLKCSSICCTLSLGPHAQYYLLGRSLWPHSSDRLSKTPNFHKGIPTISSCQGRSLWGRELSEDVSYLGGYGALSTAPS